MKGRCYVFLVLTILLLACLADDKTGTLKRVKRQVPSRSGGQLGLPLSRRRQFPPPEELEEIEEYDNSEEEEKRPVSHFRGRQPPPEEDYSEEFSFTEAPKTTTPTPQRPTSRTVVFNNRFAGRPRFGSQSSTTSTTTQTPKTSPALSSRPRFRVATPAQSQRFDVVANILNKPPPPRSSVRTVAATRTENEDKKPVAETSDTATRRSSNTRGRARGRPRLRTSSTTTTTTTTTTTEKPLEEEYYYYYESEEDPNEPIATTTSTTTTTTTARPAYSKRPTFARRPSNGRSRSTSRPVIKFDPESQFAPPPEDVIDIISEPSSTKKFTTSTTTAAPPGGIPPHLRNKYKPRTDGRFIDFLRDPNRPRELKGFDLTDYPFYIKVPEDIDFDCENMKDGYYASVPHKCQLFHYCFAGARYDFLCANYTLYDQTTFTCRFANNVDCPSSEKYYYRNDDLWKETTTLAPETTTKKRRTTPKDDDYDDEYDYDEDYEEERRRNRRR
ncbi:hypothetical protein X975_14086, partial [Stegodyphus mimosarum]